MPTPTARRGCIAVPACIRCGRITTIRCSGSGPNRFLFWAYADDADHDPRIAEVVKALNIRYVLTGRQVVRGFVMPDGLVSLDKSASWAKIYDNGEARIYEWRGSRRRTPSKEERCTRRRTPTTTTSEIIPGPDAASAGFGR